MQGRQTVLERRNGVRKYRSGMFGAERWLCSVSMAQPQRLVRTGRTAWKEKLATGRASESVGSYREKGPIGHRREIGGGVTRWWWWGLWEGELRIEGQGKVFKLSA